jgi:hypothetical protein
MYDPHITHIYIRTNKLVLVLGRRTETIQTSLMSFMITVRKVEARDGQTGINQLLEHGHFPTRGSERADNFGLTQRHVGGAQNGFERNVASAEFRAGTSNVGVANRHGSSRCRCSCVLLVVYGLCKVTLCGNDRRRSNTPPISS